MSTGTTWVVGRKRPVASSADGCRAAAEWISCTLPVKVMPGAAVDAHVDRLPDAHLADLGLVDRGGHPDRGEVVGDGQLRAGGDGGSALQPGVDDDGAVGGCPDDVGRPPEAASLISMRPTGSSLCTTLPWPAFQWTRVPVAGARRTIASPSIRASSVVT